MENLAFLMTAKLMDWPTIAIGLCCGLLVRSWASVVPIALVASLLVELLIMQVRGWAFSPSLFAVGAIAALPWVGFGFAVRLFAHRMLS